MTSLLNRDKLKRHVIIDYSNLWYRCFYGNQKDVQANPKMLAHLILTSLLNIKSQHNPINLTHRYNTDLVIAVDGKRDKLWRTEFYDLHSKQFPEYANQTYKGNRKKDEDIPWDEMMKIVHQTIWMMNTYTTWKVVSDEHAEADDVIAVLAKEFDAKGEETIIISGDSDFKQLLSQNTKVYSFYINGYMSETSIEDLLQIQILTGQSRKDNIFPCRHRLGEKTAAKILPVLEDELKNDEELTKRYQFNQTLIDFNYIPKLVKLSIMNEFEKQQDKPKNLDGLLTAMNKLDLVFLAEKANKLL